jgi:hypothetical protein
MEGESRTEYGTEVPSLQAGIVSGLPDRKVYDVFTDNEPCVQLR